jgi:hypothetical protein
VTSHPEASERRMCEVATNGREIWLSTLDVRRSSGQTV